MGYEHVNSCIIAERYIEESIYEHASLYQTAAIFSWKS